MESGSTYVNESLLTGESVPVVKKKESYVYAGTVNQIGVIFVRVTKISGETALDEISKKLKETQLKKAAIEQLTDKISGGFVYFVVAIAALTFVTWMLLTNYGIVVVADQATFPFSLKFALVSLNFFHDLIF